MFWDQTGTYEIIKFFDKENADRFIKSFINKEYKDISTQKAYLVKKADVY